MGREIRVCKAQMVETLIAEGDRVPSERVDSYAGRGVGNKLASTELKRL